MAKLIDSLDGLDHSVRRKYKKVFEKLGDEYIVRTPALDETSVANLIIEGPNQSWLFVGNYTLPPDHDELEKYISLNETLSSLDLSKVGYLAVCKEEKSLFSTVDYGALNVSIVEQQDFWARGEEYIGEKLCQLDDKTHDWVRKNLVFESVINAACTTRRQALIRDSRAQLSDFFLDYDQELAAKYDMWDESNSTELDESFSVRLINGVAGCGKTLILINRALLYCKKYPEKNVLLLIHNKPVTTDIEYKFNNYLGGIPPNLKIQTFHAYARAQQAKLTPKLNILFSNKDKKPFFDKILTNELEAYKSLTLSNSQICSELEYINEFIIKDKEQYLAFDRQGRGFSLLKSQREFIWDLYELVCKTMSSPISGYLPSLYIRNLCLIEPGGLEFDMYDQVLIDEAQFFFPSWLELVKKSIKEGGRLFMCADPNQGFLKSRLSWKSVGLNVRGRTKKLNYSYRTTYEIMVAANALLGYLKEDSEDFIQPDLDKMTHGKKPQVIYTDSSQDEKLRFINELELAVKNNAIPMEQIIVLCGETVKPWDIKRLIENRLGRNTVVNCNNSKELGNIGDKIRVMSINSCTGMESGVIFVLGVGGLLDKENNLDLKDEEKTAAREESTRKLYVAMTRAGQKLVLFSTEKLPGSVEQHLNVDEAFGAISA